MVLLKYWVLNLMEKDNFLSFEMLVREICVSMILFVFILLKLFGKVGLICNFGLFM